MCKDLPKRQLEGLGVALFWEGFQRAKITDFHQSWEGSLSGGPRRTKKVSTWLPPQLGTFKFNVDRAARGTSGPAGIRGVMQDHTGNSSIVFFEPVGRKESNEAELLSIKRALTIWTSIGRGKLFIESDSTNTVKWVTGVKRPSWRLAIVIREIKALIIG